MVKGDVQAREGRLHFLVILVYDGPWGGIFLSRTEGDGRSMLV